MGCTGRKYLQLESMMFVFLLIKCYKMPTIKTRLESKAEITI